MAETFKIAVVQMASGPAPEENLLRASRFIEEAAESGARLVGLPELFRTRYFCQSEDARCFDLAEPVAGPTIEALRALATRLEIVIVAPFFERRVAGVYHNSAAMIDATGEVAGLYRKMHIPDDPGYYEKFYFTPGDLGFQAFDTRVGRVSALICWDQWYPEAARLTALRGAQVVVYPTAIGWHPHEKQAQGARQLDAWRIVQRAHAIANGVYVAVANRVGYEKPEGGGNGVEFWGSSFIADPFGAVISEAATDREEVIVADVEPDRIEEVRRNWPFLRDRRIDAYSGLNRRVLD